MAGGAASERVPRTLWLAIQHGGGTGGTMLVSLLKRGVFFFPPLPLSPLYPHLVAAAAAFFLFKKKDLRRGTCKRGFCVMYLYNPGLLWTAILKAVEQQLLLPGVAEKGGRIFLGKARFGRASSRANQIPLSNSGWGRRD